MIETNMQRNRILADKVMEDNMQYLDSTLDKWFEENLVSFLKKALIYIDEYNIEINHDIAIISYPYYKKKLDDCERKIKLYGFAYNLIGDYELPIFIEDINLIIPNNGATHRLVCLWEKTKSTRIKIKVKRMKFIDNFLKSLVIDTKNKTVNNFYLSDVEIEFMSALKKKDIY